MALSMRFKKTFNFRMIRSLLSPAVLLVGYIYIQHLFNLFNLPFVLFLCHAALFGVVIYLSAKKEPLRLPNRIYLYETVLLTLLLVFVIFHAAKTYAPELTKPPSIDIGADTQKAAEMFFREFKNPYQTTSFGHHGDEPKYWGFHYGPMMFIGYALSAFFPKSGFKLMNLLFLLGILILLNVLVYERGRSRLQNISTGLFSSALVLVPGRLWFELFDIGINDVFTVFLLLLSLFLIRGNYWIMAGIFAGLSFSAKFSPALFFIVLLIRKKMPWRFFGGVGLGLLPLIPFFIWDYSVFLNKTFLFHLTKAFDSTSLYAITPQKIHYIFPLAKIAALWYFLTKNFDRAISYKTLLPPFILLLIIMEITFTEIHWNHLFWLIPFIALVLGWHRYQFIPVKST